MKDKKFIITGGCGFVGRNVIEELIAGGVCPGNIKVIDDLSVGTRDYLLRVCDFVETDGEWADQKDKITFVKSDVRDTDKMFLAVNDADAVIHLAGSTGVVTALKDPMNDCTSNVVGTFNILEACKKNGVNRVVYASSGAPLGKAEPPIHEETLPHPISPYGASKMACEGYCTAYYECFGLETVVLRFGNLYGPYSEHKITIVASFINSALAGEPLGLEGDGTSTRDYLFSLDLAQAIIQAAVKPGIGGEKFQIAAGIETSVNEVTDAMLKIFDRNGLKDVRIERKPARESDIARSYAITDKARDVLGWVPAHSLEEGIEKTLKWYIEKGQRPVLEGKLMSA